MPVSNPNKVVSQSTLDCDGMTTVTLSFDAEAMLKAEPADIVLIMDRSGSTGGAPLAAAKRAARELFRTAAEASGSLDGLTLENGSRMGLVSFSDTATRDLELSTDVSALIAALNALTANGLTNHSAAFSAAQAMLQGSSAGRKIIVLFTDGLTTVGPAAVGVTDAIKQEGIEIYCIGLTADPSLLFSWASDPIARHVSTTSDISQLRKLFSDVAAEVVLAGGLDMRLREILNPDFKIVRIGIPNVGSVQVVNPQTLEWTADAVATALPKTASFSFDIAHIGSTPGTKSVNDSISYTDREGSVLTFPDPKVEILCGNPIITVDPCPLPTTFLMEGCRDTAVIVANDTAPSGLGRIIQVDATIKNVCPGKQVAVAVVLTELGSDGIEHARGTKTILIPAQEGRDCQDVELKCITFVVPESLDLAGSGDTICDQRGFRTRVYANYVDSDFICCDPQTVVL